MESPTVPAPLARLLRRLQQHAGELVYVDMRIATLNEFFEAHYPLQTAKARSFLRYIAREKRVLRARLEAVEDSRMAVLDEIYILYPEVTIPHSDEVREAMYRERQRSRDPVRMEGWGLMRGEPVREEVFGFWEDMWALAESYP